MEPRTCEERVLQELATAEMTISSLAEELAALNAHQRTVWHPVDEEPEAEGFYIVHCAGNYRVGRWEPGEGWSWPGVGHWAAFFTAEEAREAIERVHDDGWPYALIASECGVTNETVASIMHRRHIPSEATCRKVIEGCEGIAEVCPAASR